MLSREKNTVSNIASSKNNQNNVRRKCRPIIRWCEYVYFKIYEHHCTPFSFFFLIFYRMPSQANLSLCQIGWLALRRNIVKYFWYKTKLMTKNGITEHSKLGIKYNQPQRISCPFAFVGWVYFMLAWKRNDITLISILLENVNVARLDIQYIICYVWYRFREADARWVARVCKRGGNCIFVEFEHKESFLRTGGYRAVPGNQSAVYK